MNRECRRCERRLPVAEDETGTPDPDECVLDSRGLIEPNYYVCGRCLEEAVEAGEIEESAL